MVLAGGSATDDPEGAQVLAEVREAADNEPDIFILELSPESHTEINALQRAATVILQKSTREGFGLTVSEGLWKGKPVIGGAVGGIPTQIVHGVNGFLVHSPEGVAFRLRFLLTHPRTDHRHAHVRGVGTVKSVAEEVWFRSGKHRHGRQRTGGKGKSEQQRQLAPVLRGIRLAVVMLFDQ